MDGLSRGGAALVGEPRLRGSAAGAADRTWRRKQKGLLVLLVFRLLLVCEVLMVLAGVVSLRLLLLCLLLWWWRMLMLVLLLMVLLVVLVLLCCLLLMVLVLVCVWVCVAVLVLLLYVVVVRLLAVLLEVWLLLVSLVEVGGDGVAGLCVAPVECDRQGRRTEPLRRWPLYARPCRASRIARNVALRCSDCFACVSIDLGARDLLGFDIAGEADVFFL